MIRAGKKEKKLVIDILSKSFENNESVNFVVGQGSNRLDHIRQLISYSFNVCNAFGDIWISRDELACAMVLYPDKKRTTINSILWDIDLALSVIGLTRVGKILKKESKIKSLHPKEPFAYLWFIGVLPKKQNQGIGSQLLEDVIHESWVQGRAVCLETSVERNLPWYSSHGFRIYNTLELDYKLHMLRINS
jgi:ribosomal protein S18 acetylase RimI-like enzyme